MPKPRTHAKVLNGNLLARPKYPAASDPFDGPPWPEGEPNLEEAGPAEARDGKLNAGAGTVGADDPKIEGGDSLSEPVFEEGDTQTRNDGTTDAVSLLYVTKLQTSSTG